MKGVIAKDSGKRKSPRTLSILRTGIVDKSRLQKRAKLENVRIQRILQNRNNFSVIAARHENSVSSGRLYETI